MKNIKKNSKEDLGVQEFVCENCHSEFESDEYGIRYTEIVGDWKFGKGYQYIPNYALDTDCPVCENGTSKYIPTGEKPYWAGHAI